MKYTGIIGIIVISAALFNEPVHALEQGGLIDAASALLQSGKPDSAAVLLYDIIDSIDDRNERVRGLYYLSQALGQLGRVGEKIQCLASAAELGPDAPYADRVGFSHAEVLLKTGNVNGCISVAQNFFNTHADSPLMPEVLFLMGEAFLLKSDWNKAFKAFSDITGNYRESPLYREAMVKEGVCLYKIRLVSGAIERFSKYLDETPKGSSADDALYYLGLSLEQNGRYGPASRSFRRLTLEYPSYSHIIDAWYHLGRSCFEEGDYSAAENAFVNYIDNARRSDPSYDDALFCLERIAFRKGYYTSETEIAEHFVAKNPMSRLAPRLFLDLAKYYRLSGEPERAIEKYRDIRDFHPGSDYADSAIFYEADIYVSMKRIDDAFVFLREIIQDGNVPARIQAVYFKMGALGEELMLSAQAIAWYDSAVSVGVSPDVTVKSLMGVARCYRDVNRWLDTSRTYERILRTFPNTPHRADVYYSLAGVYFLMGRLYDAIQTGKDGLKIAHGKRKIDFLVFLADVSEYIDPDQALQYSWTIWSSSGAPPETRIEALLKIGDISAKRGDRKSAMDAYAKVIASKGDSLYIRKALKRIGDLGENKGSPKSSTPQ